jgi:hypothetical protein
MTKKLRLPVVTGVKRMSLMSLVSLYGDICGYEHIGMTSAEREEWVKRTAVVWQEIQARVVGTG